LLNYDTDWSDLVYRNGITQNYEVSASGGDEKTRFYIGGNYYNEQGTLTNSGYKRFNVRMNLSINYLMYVAEKKPFIETIRSVWKTEGRFADESKSRNYKVKAACMDFLGSLWLVPNNPDYAE
jgi:hypothetical protein